MKSISIITFILAGMLAISLMSCDSDKATTTITVEEKKKEIIWDWKAFPQASVLSLRNMPLDIQPKQSFQIKSEASGILTLEITEKTSTVKKGDVIARMDVDTLSEQEERLKIQEEKQLLSEMKEEKLDRPEKRKKALEDLKEAKRKVRLVEMILKNPAMSEMSQELFGPGFDNINKESLKEAQETLKLAEKKMAWAEEFEERLREGQKRIEEMDMAKNKRQHQDVKDRSVYTAPFDGELRLEVNHIKDQVEYTVNGRETIATLNDYEEIYAYLNVANAKWVSLQPERLYIQLTDKNRTLMNFHEDIIAKDKRTQKEERQYIFSIPLKSNESLKRLAGTKMQGELLYKLPESCYIVPKFDLSLYSLGKTESLDWQTIVKELWPSAQVLAEGRKHLAIKF